MKEVTSETIEVKDSALIEWMYPDIYGKKRQQSEITISLFHVRAANNLNIRFDSDRNGYVLYMDKTKDMDGYCETIEEHCEVGFVPAWNEVEPDKK